LPQIGVQPLRSNSARPCAFRPRRQPLEASRRFRRVRTIETESGGTR